MTCPAHGALYAHTRAGGHCTRCGWRPAYPFSGAALPPGRSPLADSAAPGPSPELVTEARRGLEQLAAVVHGQRRFGEFGEGECALHDDARESIRYVGAGVNR